MIGPRQRDAAWDSSVRPASPSCAGGREDGCLPCEASRPPSCFPRGSHAAILAAGEHFGPSERCQCMARGCQLGCWLGMCVQGPSSVGHRVPVAGVAHTAPLGPAAVTLGASAGDSARAGGNGKPGQHINKPHSAGGKRRAEKQLGKNNSKHMCFLSAAVLGKMFSSLRVGIHVGL